MNNIEDIIMDKADKKTDKKAYKEKLLVEFRKSLPMDEAKFPPLFDALDDELSHTGCKDDFTLLEKYCEKENLNAPLLKDWFKQHGGFCDCEIIMNVEEMFEYLNKPAIKEKPQKKEQSTIQCKKLDTLQTDYGFTINKVPIPWTLIAISKGDETNYQFQISKKSNFPLSLVKSFPIDKLSDDNFLQEYWIKKIELDYDLEFIIERKTTQDFELVQVKTKRWIPVFLFVYKQNAVWCLIMKTESMRVRNDIKDLEKLINEIN